MSTPDRDEDVPPIVVIGLVLALAAAIAAHLITGSPLVALGAGLLVALAMGLHRYR